MLNFCRIRVLIDNAVMVMIIILILFYCQSLKLRNQISIVVRVVIACVKPYYW